MRIIYLQCLLALLLILLVGCDSHVENKSVGKELNQLENAFNIQWPTNYISANAGSVSTFRGDKEIVAKLEVADSTFWLWRQSSTNRLFEMRGFKVSVDPNLDKKFPWWDCSKYPYSQVIHYYTDKHATQNGYLDVFVVKTNKLDIMYIKGSI